MKGIFQFKQFSVDQTGCAMKINTDGVLLGALAEADEPESILDIGTGTGVIALMLAQRFTSAKIDAVEIDETAAKTAGNNFETSPFAGRLSIFPIAIQDFFKERPTKKYDLIVSNPPFHINSLESPKAKKTVAKHTGEQFFKDLVEGVAGNLSENGSCSLVLPPQVAELVRKLANVQGLYLKKTIGITSFAHDAHHREIMCFGWEQIKEERSSLVIYEAVGEYSTAYKQLLQPYFIAF